MVLFSDGLVGFLIYFSFEFLIREVSVRGLGHSVVFNLTLMGSRRRLQ